MFSLKVLQKVLLKKFYPSKPLILASFACGTKNRGSQKIDNLQCTLLFKSF